MAATLSETRARDTTLFLGRVEQRRQQLSSSLDDGHRAQFGQYFTPEPAADLIAKIVSIPDSGVLNVLDPGAGIGSLTAALVARVIDERPSISLSISAVEVDPLLIPFLEQTLLECRTLAADHGIKAEIRVIEGDFMELASDWTRPFFDQFNLVIMNPPYRKLAASSAGRRKLSKMGIESPNLYSSFLALGALALVPDGQLVAITPRSFANGPYFGPFRKLLLSHLTIDQIHVFESRTSVFADCGVLQENIVISGIRSAVQQSVRLSTSRGDSDNVVTREVPYEEIVRPLDTQKFINIPIDEADTAVAEMFARFPCTIEQTGVEVSTGRVVDFRARNYLLSEPSTASVPLIYPSNMKDGRVSWPREVRKPQALVANTVTQKLIHPNERFVLVKRFSAKEERRRVVAAVYEPISNESGVGFENHLNVFHVDGRTIDRELAYGLCLWLNSSVVDRFFRTFSGHTQVNATDLRSMRYPPPEQLRRLGSKVPGDWPDQSGIDELVSTHVLAGTLVV
jgi:adenine-specific DNA-methyltransferase